MARPRKEQVEANGVPFLNDEKNTGSTDNVELGESNQSELGFDEPAQLGVNVIVAPDKPKPTEVSTEDGVITDEDDPQPRDNIQLITNSDGTLLRVEAV